ncbi:MAG TPA: hypothetical protein VNY34_03425 [Solirubrobacteraceae bacterium]|nr:hypothetical protein [Solirubrobacteraceae bacterium]
MRRATLIAALLSALAIPAAPAPAATWVSYPRVLQQIRSTPLIWAVVNRGPAHVEIKFHDLSEWKASYPRSEQARLLQLLHARHVRVIFATPRARHAAPVTVHHHLRYIAAGVLAALLVSGAAFYLYSRRRRGVTVPGAGAPER